MSWMETLNRNMWPLYLLGGLFLGTFIGYKVLPQLLSPPVAAVVETESAAQLLARQSLEARLAEGLVLFDGVDAARVQLSVALAGNRLSDETLRGIAKNVAKVLGILAALMTLRFMIQAIGKGIGVEEENGGC